MEKEMNRIDFVKKEFLRRGLPVPALWINPEEASLILQQWEEEEAKKEDISVEELVARRKLDGKTEDPGVPKRFWDYPRGEGARDALEQEFCETYAQYIADSRDDEDPGVKALYNRLIDLLGQLSTYKIFGRIQSLEVYITGDEEDITQEGHISVMELLRQDRASAKNRDNVVGFYQSIYKKRTMDYLRFYGLLKDKKQKEEDRERQELEAQGISVKETSKSRSRARIADVNNTESIEKLATSFEGEDQSDRLALLSADFVAPGLKNGNGESGILLKLYVSQLMEAKKDPPGPLALMYARILYQAETLMDPETFDALVQEYMAKKNWSTDPDDEEYFNHLYVAGQNVVPATATNPEWALNRMRGMNMWQLVRDSEESARTHVDERVFWGEEMYSRLQEEAAPFKPDRWTDVVFTDHYEKKHVENWASDVHNATVREIARIVSRDQDLYEFVDEFFRKKNKLKESVRRERNKNADSGKERK